MNRRSFLKGLAASFVVPELIVPERKVWALDKTMIREPIWQDFSWQPMDKTITHVNVSDLSAYSINQHTNATDWEHELWELKRRIRNDLNIALFYGIEGK